MLNALSKMFFLLLGIAMLWCGHSTLAAEDTGWNLQMTNAAELWRTPSKAESLTFSSDKKSRPKAVYNTSRTSRPVVALTFDDGPHGVLTPKLLDVLRDAHVRATFFVLGSNVSAYPDIARRIVAEGHEIASHSWSHPSLTKVSAGRFEHEIRDTTDIIERTTGQRVTMMRPPYGALNHRVTKALLEDYQLDVILWDVDPLDWRRPGSDAITRRLVSGAHPGAILLAHDIHPGTIAAIPATIAQLKAKGFSFATVSELLAMDEPTLQKSPMQKKPDAPSISVSGSIPAPEENGKSIPQRVDAEAHKVAE